MLSGGDEIVVSLERGVVRVGFLVVRRKANYCEIVVCRGVVVYSYEVVKRESERAGEVDGMARL